MGAIANGMAAANGNYGASSGTGTASSGTGINGTTWAWQDRFDAVEAARLTAVFVVAGLLCGLSCFIALGQPCCPCLDSEGKKVEAVGGDGEQDDDEEVGDKEEGGDEEDNYAMRKRPKTCIAHLYIKKCTHTAVCTQDILYMYAYILNYYKGHKAPALLCIVSTC